MFKSPYITSQEIEQLRNETIGKCEICHGKGYYATYVNGVIRLQECSCVSRFKQRLFTQASGIPLSYIENSFQLHPIEQEFVQKLDGCLSYPYLSEESRERGYIVGAYLLKRAKQVLLLTESVLLQYKFLEDELSQIFSAEVIVFSGNATFCKPYLEFRALKNRPTVLIGFEFVARMFKKVYRYDA